MTQLTQGNRIHNPECVLIPAGPPDAGGGIMARSDGQEALVPRPHRRVGARGSVRAGDRRVGITAHAPRVGRRRHEHDTEHTPTVGVWEGAATTMADPLRDANDRPRIIGQSRSLNDEEARNVEDMIRDAQHSDRQLTIPREDLAQGATTTMAPDVARVVSESHVLEILKRFNRDYLYGQGRFDEYDRGFLLKWGDGYSRKHIWVTVEGENLVFETSHGRKCAKAYCTGGHHVLTPDLWHDIRTVNAELAEQFQRPVHERSDD